MSVTTGDANTDAILTTLATLPTTFNNSLAGAVDVNAAFTLGSGYLVFFMHCGFAMISVGCVRSKFAKHIAMLILTDACASGIAWYFFGYAIGFGDRTGPGLSGVPTNSAGYPGVNGGTSTNNPFLGTRFFAMKDLPWNQYNLWYFQWTFCATACTIVSGAIAERARFESYILYTSFMAAWVYPIVTHASWSPSSYIGMFRQNGHLLFGSGAIDFAGSGVVHMVGGYAALVGCAILGPRLGRFRADGTVVDYPAHNYSLFILGVMILWFGWYGFNPGSETAILPAGTSNPVAVAAVATTLAPCSSGLTALVVKAMIVRFRTGARHYDLMAFGNGTLAGLVAITSPCSTVYPWAAIIIGGVSGVLYCIGSEVSIILHLDDPLDAIAVHCWNGTWGLIAPGLFSAEDLIANAYGNIPTTTNPRTHFGCFLGGDGNLLAAQLVDVLFIAGWVSVNMAIFFGILKVAGLFRVDPKDEEDGLDHSYHGGSAYGDTTGEFKPTYSKSEVADLRMELDAIKAQLGMNGGNGKFAANPTRDGAPVLSTG
jgi:Amt family ammonium transporter